MHNIHVRRPQAIREGRHPADSPVKRPRGQTRGQTRLVPAPAPHNHDLRSVLIVAAAASYCQRLNPSPVKGTLAETAVLGYFSTDKVLSKLLGNVKTQLYRLSNRPLLKESIGVIDKFVNTGTDEEKNRKLALFRTLGDEFDDDVAQEMAYRIVECLVTVSKGRPPNDRNKRGFYPYGRQAGNDTQHTHIHTRTLTHTHTHTHTHTQVPQPWPSKMYPIPFFRRPSLKCTPS